MYQEKIQRGMAWLDDTKPDWKATYRRGILDMSLGHRCVLGRAFRDEAEQLGALTGFSYACDQFALEDDWLAEHGFDVGPGKGAEYPALTKAWEEALAKVLA